MSLRPIGTYGPVGASTTIYESTWICKSCSYKNFSDRTTCKRCKSKKPPALKGSESKEEQQVGDHDWREVLDPTSQQMYYYNTKTMETKWDRPEVMGASPYASGWFGRGGAPPRTHARLRQGGQGAPPRNGCPILSYEHLRNFAHRQYQPAWHCVH